MTKKCKDCEKILPVANFTLTANVKGGTKYLKSICKLCNARRFRDAYVDMDVAERRRWNTRRNAYNLTKEEYEATLQAQGGGCAVCGTQTPGGVGAWHIDHDHSCCPEKKKSCGKCVRGLLCNKCNSGIGIFADDPERLISAAAYLMQFQTRKVTH